MNATPDADELQQRLAQLQAELHQLQRVRRTNRLQTILMLGIVVVVATVGSAMAANGNCPNGMPFCFGANQPARASEINHNFAQLKEWLEAKVGTVGTGVNVPNAAVFASNVSVSGGLSAATLSSTGAATVSGLLTASNGLTVNNGLTVSGAAIVDGYQVSCLNGVPDQTFPVCCRIDVRTGGTACKVATNWNGTAWANTAGNPTGPFAATTPGHYSLHCHEGVHNVNYPMCCRSSSNGAVTCKVAQNWALSSWGAEGSVF